VLVDVLRNDRPIRLLDAEPELARFLSPDERAQAAGLMLPTTRFPNGPFDISAALDPVAAFGALVLDGMLLERLVLGDHAGLRLVGPGDVISLTRQPRPMLFSYADCRVGAPMRVALLGPEMLLAVRRWPALLSGLQELIAEQSDRLVAQLLICQLPRVDQRLLAIMWLLAESWGHVTALGTSLPLNLTHDALGGLIGARRSTVTLALGELAERGAVIRQDRGWLLLEAPAPASAPSKERQVVSHVSLSAWTSSAPAAELAAVDARGELMETVKRLRYEHMRSREKLQHELKRLQSSRTRAAERRARITRRNRSSAPSG